MAGDKISDFLRVSPSVLKRPRKPCMDVSFDDLSLNVRKKNEKTGNPVFFLKIVGFFVGHQN